MNGIPEDAISYLRMCIQKGLFYGEIVAIRRRMIEASDGHHTIFVAYSDLAEKYVKSQSGMSFLEKQTCHT